MNIDEIGKILELFEQSELDELQIEMEGVRISARRQGAGPGHGSIAPLPEAVEPRPATVEPARAAREAPDARPASPVAPRAAVAEAVAVRTPIGGTFYRASSPTAEPFVVVGTRVGAADAIGLIEVMKLFNHVPAGVAGEVVEIACENAAVVEAGEVLMYIRPL